CWRVRRQESRKSRAPLPTRARPGKFRGAATASQRRTA
ncbi:MAG: hypothetical protein AVDCRST_MAG80-1069, partial [uncultured Rubrobacteraceae bacterium]